MKKTFIYLLVIISILLVNFNYSKSSCPPGFTSGFYQDTYSYGAFICNVDISYCCKWDNDLKKVIVEIQDVVSTYNNNCIAFIPDFQDFINWLHSSILNQAQNLCAPPYPPCDDEEAEPHYEFESHVARCWKYVNENLYPGDNVYTLHLKPCYENVECVYTWELCLDYNFTPPKLREKLIGKEAVGIPNCMTSRPELPPQNMTWDEPWETYCFETECE